MNKVTIIGTGKVGAACAQALALRGSCEELLLIDADSSLAVAQASDLAQSAALLGDVRIESGNYQMMGSSKVVIIAAGKRLLEGSDAKSVLEENRRMLLEVIPQIVKNAPHAVIVVASQPVDALTQYVVNIVGQARASQVIGVGTLLETGTLRAAIAHKLGLHSRNIHGSVIGEEGVLGAVLWSSINVAGVPLLEYLKNKNIAWNLLDQQEVTDQVKHQALRAARTKGSPCYGVGAAAARVTEAILKNTHEVLTVSAFTPHYGVSMSLPRVVGRQGIAETIWPTLDETEQHSLELVLQVLRRMQVEGEVRG
jgi:L-lactate dehydrogenase